jgi:homeobox-leucine zipper protein
VLCIAVLECSALYNCLVLCSAYQQNGHLDEPTRRALGAKISLEAMQAQYWFQNQHSQMQVTVTHILFSFHACMINCTASGAKSQRIDSYSFFLKFLQAKAMVQNSKVAQLENTTLTAENVSLHQAILKSPASRVVTRRCPPSCRPGAGAC